MAHVELELISNVVERQDWRDVHASGLTPEHFLTEEGYLVFNWIYEEHKKDRTVPDKKRLLRKFPSFEFCASTNPTKALIRELRESGIRSEARTVLEDLTDALENGEDPMEALQLYLPSLKDLMIEFAEPEGVFMSKSAKEMQTEYLETSNSGGILGFPYPWAPLNEATGGIQRGQFVVLFARPKQMKTWTALAIAAHCYLESGLRVAIYSKEMTVPQMRRRVASIIAGLDDGQIRTATLSPDDEGHYFDTLDALTALEDAQLTQSKKPSMMFLSDKGVKGGSTPESLRARIERFEPDVLIVDGFYLMRDARSGKKDRDWKTVSNISADLKEMALEMNIGIIGTTQANRSSDKDSKHISPDDLSGLAFADAIGQDADVVIQIIKGKDPNTGKPILLLLFPGVRDAEIRPFVINANPGKDFSLRQRKVNIGAFLEEAKKLWAQEAAEEEAANSGEGGTPKEPVTGGEKQPVKRKRTTKKEPQRNGGLRS